MQLLYYFVYYTPIVKKQTPIRDSPENYDQNTTTLLFRRYGILLFLFKESQLKSF